MSRMLVTGGAGFIGSNLSRLLLDRGHAVTILDDLSSGYASNLEAVPEATLVEGDVRDPGAVDRAIEGCEVVFHLAASVGNTRSIQHPRLDAEINVLGTLTVLEAARHHGLRKLVFSSSAGIFGELKTVPITEDHPVEPDSPYGASKLGAEKLCLSYAKLYPLECVCLRYFNVYGPRQDPTAEYAAAVPGFIVKALAEQPLTIYGDGRQTRDFIFVEDVARANLAAFESNVNNAEALNIGSGKSVTILDLARRVVRLTGAKSKILYDEPRLGEVRYSSCEVEAARAKIRFRPKVALNEGLRRTIEYWRTEAPH